MLRWVACALLSLVAGCTVGDRYLISTEHFTAVKIMTSAERQRHVVPAHRDKNGQPAWVRAHSFSLTEAEAHGEEVSLPTRLPSRRIVVGSTLVWIGTPLSIAGLCMVIWGRDALRWSGVALSAVGEPVMIAGTVLWIQGARAHPQEVPPGIADLNYLPEPGR
jgi:hypothetical protein